MGKGNIVLGYARGSVGSIVLARVKGQQIVKARNAKPHNKKTRAQILHRARLSTLYKFTRLMEPGFLDGAFEDMRKGENWQSCFVRHNVRNAVPQIKDWVEDGTRPCYGKFLMSSGSINASLARASNVEYDDWLGCAGMIMTALMPNATIGQLSKNLIQYNNLMVGDVVNFVRYVINFQRDSRVPAPERNSSDTYLQVESFIVDPDSTQRVLDALPSYSFFVYMDDDGNRRVYLGYRVTVDEQDCFTIIVTRQEEGRSLCNTAQLLWPGTSADFWQHFESDDYIRNVLRSWGMSREAVLKG